MGVDVVGSGALPVIFVSFVKQLLLGALFKSIGTPFKPMK
jgi:hypothetical protein